MQTRYPCALQATICRPLLAHRCMIYSRLRHVLDSGFRHPRILKEIWLTVAGESQMQLFCIKLPLEHSAVRTTFCLLCFLPDTSLLALPSHINTLLMRFVHVVSVPSYQSGFPDDPQAGYLNFLSYIEYAVTSPRSCLQVFIFSLLCFFYNCSVIALFRPGNRPPGPFSLSVSTKVSHSAKTTWPP